MRALGDLVGGDGHHALALQLGEQGRDDPHDEQGDSHEHADGKRRARASEGGDHTGGDRDGHPTPDEHNRDGERQEGDQDEQSEAPLQSLEGSREESGDFHWAGPEHGGRGEHGTSLLRCDREEGRTHEKVLS